MQSAHKAQSRVRSVFASVMLGAALVLPAIGHAQDSATTPVLAVPDFTGVVAKTEGSVVNIRTTETVQVRGPGMGPGGPGGDPYELFRWFFGPEFAPPGAEPPRGRGTPRAEPEERTVPRGVGSGFFISKDG